jgi:hypothetical protein
MPPAVALSVLVAAMAVLVSMAAEVLVAIQVAEVQAQSPTDQAVADLAEVLVVVEWHKLALVLLIPVVAAVLAFMAQAQVAPADQVEAL